ncbi:MAG TPA: hypothetical protein VFS33_09025, partial [Gemmatimonadales bacterium]|nr:hypothetical protein [Gemmatimonadales bacterium]
MRRHLFACLLLAAIPAAAQAQASQFGVRGLGFPGREESARALGTAGAFGLFDGESSLTPASLAYLGLMTASFNGMSDYRSSESPAGSASIRNFRFPQFLVGGPIKGFPLAASFSYSNYMTRDFSLAFPGTTSFGGGPPIGIVDTLESNGGINDLRLALAYRPGRRVSIGVAGHILTGTNRLTLKRVFSDTLYATALQRSELSFSSYGISVGLLAQLTNTLAISALARTDGTAGIERDSTAEVGQVDLPITLGGGLRWHASRRLELAGHAIWRNWSTANDQLLALGGTGANNTLEFAGGLEFATNGKHPGHLPLRLGVRSSTLPFPVNVGEEAKEFGVAAGTSYSFAAERGTLSFALERVWRSEAAGYS